MNSWKSIVCAVDESPGSLAAIGAAARLARDLQAKLLLIHVDPKPTGEALFAPPIARRSLPDFDQLEKWSATATALRGEQVGVQPIAGDAADEIVGFARRTGADLIVVGSRARTRVTLALGSVAAKVLVRAPCPVLVVSPESEERIQLKSDFAGQIA